MSLSPETRAQIAQDADDERRMRGRRDFHCLRCLKEFEVWHEREHWCPTCLDQCTPGALPDEEDYPMCGCGDIYDEAARDSGRWLVWREGSECFATCPECRDDLSTDVDSPEAEVAPAQSSPPPPCRGEALAVSPLLFTLFDWGSHIAVALVAAGLMTLMIKLAKPEGGSDG